MSLQVCKSPNTRFKLIFVDTRKHKASIQVCESENRRSILNFVESQSRSYIKIKKPGAKTRHRQPNPAGGARALRTGKRLTLSYLSLARSMFTRVHTLGRTYVLRMAGICGRIASASTSRCGLFATCYIMHANTRH